MSYAPSHAEAPLRQFAAALGKSLRRPVRVQWAASTHGNPCAWVEVQDEQRGAQYARAASLTIELRGPTASYVVAQANKSQSKKFPALATALRELRKNVVRTAASRPAAEAQSPAANAADALQGPAPYAAEQVTQGSQNYRTKYTADQAAGHPVIRAVVIVSHEVRRVKGETPDPIALLALANKALDVVDLLVPPGQPEAATDAWVERALVGMLTGALLAV